MSTPFVASGSLTHTLASSAQMTGYRSTTVPRQNGRLLTSFEAAWRAKSEPFAPQFVENVARKPTLG